jgi:uncharacterized protein
MLEAIAVKGDLSTAQWSNHLAGNKVVATYKPIRPTSAGKRIDVLDILRGIAVCGILPVNIFVMGLAGGTQGRTFPATWNADWIAWSVQKLLFEGPMRGLFTVLFGAGMVLMLRKSEGPNGQVTPVDVWTRRCLVLLLFGVMHFALLMWPGEILWTYGVAGLALLAFRTASARTLWIWALVIVACLSVHRAWDTGTYVTSSMTALAGEQAVSAGREPTPEQEEAMEAAASTRAANYPAPGSNDEEIAQRTSWPGVLSWSASGWSFRHLGVYSWIGVAESLSFMLFGMALMRSGILTGESSAATYWRLLLIGAGLGLTFRGIDFAWQARSGFEIDIHKVVPLMSWLRSGWYQPARLALTLGYIGAFVLLVRGVPGVWMEPFRALGRMALTTYTLQSILTSVLFYALGYLDAFGAAGLLVVSLGICVITAVFCMAWLSRLSIGPVEWLLRALAYSSFVRWRRDKADDTLAHSPPL